MTVPLSKTVVASLLKDYPPNGLHWDKALLFFPCKNYDTSLFSLNPLPLKCRWFRYNPCFGVPLAIDHWISWGNSDTIIVQPARAFQVLLSPLLPVHACCPGIFGRTRETMFNLCEATTHPPASLLILCFTWPSESWPRRVLLNTPKKRKKIWLPLVLSFKNSTQISPFWCNLSMLSFHTPCVGEKYLCLQKNFSVD